MEPTSGHWEKDLDLESILEPLGLPGGLLGGPWWEPFSPLDPPWPPPRSPGSQFLAIWASPLLDADSGPQKSQKKLNFEGARTLKIELSPARECNFHIFTSFLPEPQNHRFWELFWEPFGSLFAPFGPPGRLLGLPGASLGLPRGVFLDTAFLIVFLMPF